MSIVETTLIFLAIPAAVIVVVAALVYGRAAAGTPRYRPGNPWQFEPVWYLPHPEHSGPVSSLPPGSLDGRAPTHQTLTHQALAGQALAGQVSEPVTASGGASGEW